MRKPPGESKKQRAKALGEVIRQARLSFRESTAVSQKELASWLGWNRAKVSRIEVGEAVKICVFDARKLCRILGLDFERTIGRVATMDASTPQARKHIASKLTGKREE